MGEGTNRIPETYPLDEFGEYERDGEVEGVIGRLVLDDERVPGK